MAIYAHRGRGSQEFIPMQEDTNGDLAPTAEMSKRALLVAIARLQCQMHKEQQVMTAAMDRLTAEVTETRSSVTAVLALVAGLAEQIRTNAQDPVALNALADELDASQASIAEAVTANTPAANEPAPGEGGTGEPGTGGTEPTPAEPEV